VPTAVPGAVSPYALVWVLGSGLSLSVMGDTDVELRFDPPVHVAGQDGPATRVAFRVDDPQAVVRPLRDRAVPAGR
jgi:hypothetical protein